MPISHSGHGGNCCGRRHFYYMNGATTASILQVIRTHHLDHMNKIVEIVISEENADYEQLKTEITGAGFVLVAEWDNDSGSTCWMYLWAPNWTAFPDGVPVAGPAAPVERIVYRDAPAPAPRVIYSTFHNVLMAGRSEAGFGSYALARAAAPRARSVDRRDVYASGAVRWTTSVGE
jgi:hypothetical protein